MRNRIFKKENQNREKSFVTPTRSRRPTSRHSYYTYTIEVVPGPDKDTFVVERELRTMDWLPAGKVAPVRGKKTSPGKPIKKTPHSSKKETL